jgi:hypothetical protein
MAERGSSKHGPLHDEELRHETEGLVRGGRSTHAEEWADPEPAGEDQPDVDYAPGESLTGGTPEGLDKQEVADRSDLARYLPRDAFPDTPAGLRERAASAGAPDRVLAVLDRLDGDTSSTVQQVWDAAGGGREQRP